MTKKDLIKYVVGWAVGMLAAMAIDRATVHSMFNIQDFIGTGPYDKRNVYKERKEEE